MTKKDYELIAEPFKEAVDSLKVQYRQVTDKQDKAMIDRQLFTVETLVRALSNKLFHDNYSFDTEKFTKACGLE